MKLLFTFLFITAFATVSFGQITGTKHDFSASAWSGGEICVACHTPHNALAISNAPLWNHLVTTQTFTPYSSTGTLNATVGQPSGVSKLCLSCHDGTTKIDAIGGAVGSATIGAVAGNFGLDLSNDHPISFVYNSALVTADGGTGLKAVTALSGLGGSIENDMLFGAVSGSKTVECSSCHDVHNAGFASLLRKSNAGSALCLTCHSK
jgi:predicted CXXCH cytochrome family protein